jgi:hypothetical protein
VSLFGWELVRRGREYKGTLPSTAFCGGRRVEGTQTVTLRVIDPAVVGRVLFVSTFEGMSEVGFPCGGEEVHAVAGISGTLADLG